MDAGARPQFRMTGGRQVEFGLGVYSGKLGMWVFLCSEVMFFTALIGTYLLIRNGQPAAAPMVTKADGTKVTIGTASAVL